MRRLYIAVGIIALLAIGAVAFVLFQLTILNPPVVGPTYPETLKLRKFQETVATPGIETYPSFAAGQARVYHSRGSGRAVLLLPDSGTGAWLYDNYLGSLGSTFNLNAVSLRGMYGAKPATTATFDDYLQDARDAMKTVLATTGREKVVVAGTGLGSLLALRLANEQAASVEGLILISPYIPRDRTDMQDWLAVTIGKRIYSGVLDTPQNAYKFWQENYPSLITQSGLANKSWQQYASKKVPFEYAPVVNDIVLGRIPWLQAQYDALARASFPVVQLGGRYDVTNPEASQLRLQVELKDALDGRFYSSIFNSGKLIPLDWKWKESASVLVDFLLDLRLDTPIIEEQEQLEPGLEPSN